MRWTRNFKDEITRTMGRIVLGFVFLLVWALLPTPQAQALTNTCNQSGTYSGSLLIGIGESLTLDGGWYCGAITINAGGTLFVTPWNGTGTTGTLSLFSDSIDISGTINGDGRGYSGGSGGSGGTGGAGGAGSPSGAAGQAGSQGTAGGSVQAGSGTYGGSAGTSGPARNGGNGGAGGALPTQGQGGGGGNAASAGTNGGYAGAGANGDTSTDETVTPGSGGGGGGGGSGGGGGGGAGSNSGSVGGNGGNGGAGGGGGSGGGGGAAISVSSRGTLAVSGTISSRGTAATAAGSGAAGSAGGNGTGINPGSGGSGGGVGATGSAGTAPAGTTAPGGGGGGGGANGAAGGSGSGGGVSLKSTQSGGLSVSGTIDTRGGAVATTGRNQSSTNSGTVKLIGVGGFTDTATINAGRTLSSINSCGTSGPIVAGSVLIVSSGGSVTLSGTYYCDIVDIQSGGLLNVTTYDGSAGTGTLTLYATTINIAGTVNGIGDGYAGGAAGSGGSGGSGGTGGQRNTSAPGGTGGTGNAGVGGSAGAGPVGGVAGSAGTAGSGGSGGAAGGTAGAGIGGNGGTAGVAGAGGSDGGYLSSGANGDTSTDTTVVMGSGGAGGSGGGGAGGGGGGGSGGDAILGNNGGGGGPGSGGGGGGAGGRGGAALRLIAEGSLTVSGSILLNGQSGTGGASSTSGSPGANGAGTPGAGGAGGAAGGTDGSPGANGGGTVGGGGGGGGGSGGNGGAGGDGAGGGLLLQSTAGGVTIQSGATIDLRGGNLSSTGHDQSATNSGTFKLFYATTFVNGSANEHDGRFYASDTDAAPSAPGTPSTTTPTADNTPSFTWTAATDDVGLRGTDPYEVQWSQSGTFASGVTTAFAGTTSCALSTTVCGGATGLADGTWYVRVRAYDSLNQVGNYSATGSVVIDTTAPTTPGTPSTSSPTTDVTPTWTWAASVDSGSGLRNDLTYQVQWSQDGSFATGVSSDYTSSATDPDPAAYTHPTSLALGTWYFRVRAFDALGTASAFSGSGSVIIQASGDSTPPSVPGMPSTSSPTTDSTPNFGWTASTDDTGVDHYEVQWSQDSAFGSGVTSATTATASCALSATTCSGPAGLADGTWYVRVRARDAAGNTSVFSATGSVVIDTTAPTTPGTPSTSSPTTDSTPTWTWTPASDSGTGLRSANPYEFQWSQDAGFGSGVSSGFSDVASYTHTTPLADGTWYVRVRAYDSLNQVGNYSAIGSVVIDTTAPTTPGTPSTSSPTTDVTPTWTWAASVDSGSGLRNDLTYQVQWSQDGSFATGVSSDYTSSATDPDPAAYTHPTSLALGTWYFRVRAFDALGTASAFSGSGSVTIENQPSPPPPSPGGPTGGSGASGNGKRPVAGSGRLAGARSAVARFVAPEARAALPDNAAGDPASTVLAEEGAGSGGPSGSQSADEERDGPGESARDWVRQPAFWLALLALAIVAAARRRRRARPRPGHFGDSR